MKKYALSIHGHATSITLEPEFWTALGHIAENHGTSRTALITRIDDTRTISLSGAVRVFVLRNLIDTIKGLKKQISDQSSP